MVLLKIITGKNGSLQLPNSSWAIPVMTAAVIALAVAVALV